MITLRPLHQRTVMANLICGLFVLWIVLGISLAGCGVPATSSAPVATATPDPFAQTLAAFEVELETLRQEMKIPGLSAAIVKEGKLVWARGFGYADVENNIPAAADTPYHLASVTKPFAALVLMQLVEDGRLSLDDPVSRYGVTLPEGDAVTVRHLLSHTSAWPPGANYQYDGNRYGLLSQVIKAATGRSFQEWLFERILQPLGMNNTAPTTAGCVGLPFAPACDRLSKDIARPYQLDSELQPIPGYYQGGFSTAAGLISTVVDLAKLDKALDANLLLPATAKEQMFTPTISTTGRTLPYGLGWFTQQYEGTHLIWHYGFNPPSISSLFLKMPDQNLTFIILANIDGLSRPFLLGDGNVLTSLPAITFYKYFVLAPRSTQPLPGIDWSGDSSEVHQRIGQVQDTSMRDLLTKEYFARYLVGNSLTQVKEQNKLLAAKLSQAWELAKVIDLKTLDSYAGVYELDQPGGLITLTVSRVKDALYIDGPEGLPEELLPLSRTRFFLAENDVYEIEFTSDGTNQATGLVVTVYNQSFLAKKK